MEGFNGVRYRLRLSRFDVKDGHETVGNVLTVDAVILQTALDLSENPRMVVDMALKTMTDHLRERVFRDAGA